MIMGLRYKTSGHEKSVKPPLSMSQGPSKTHLKRKVQSTPISVEMVLIRVLDVV